MINKKYEMVLFSFLMSLFMSGFSFMSFVVTFINLGFVDGFLSFWLNAYWKAFIIAFPTIFIVVPQVRKIVNLLLEKRF